MNIDSILKSMEAMSKEIPPLPQFFVNKMCEGSPHMQLAENVSVTPEFRAEMNKWMLEFFGKKDDVTLRYVDPANPGVVIYITSQTIFDKLKAENVTLSHPYENLGHSNFDLRHNLRRSIGNFQESGNVGGFPGSSFLA